MTPFCSSSARSLAHKTLSTHTSNLPDAQRETVQSLFTPTADPSAALRRRRAPPRPARRSPDHVLRDEKQLYRLYCTLLLRHTAKGPERGAGLGRGRAEPVKVAVQDH